MLWSDPEPDQKGWGENDRGVSFTFGTDVVTKFLNRHDLDLVRGDSTPPQLSAVPRIAPAALQTSSAALDAILHGRSSARCVLFAL